MKTKRSLSIFKSINLLAVMIFISSTIFAQAVTEADSTSQEPPKKEKKVKQKRDAFKVYAGANFNDLNVSSDIYETNMKTGFLVGASYKRGRFFYWEIGARFNHYVYELKDLVDPIDSTNAKSFATSAIEIPVSGGINLTSFVDRLVGVRIFISAVPSFAIGVGDNDLGITKNDINSFNFLGQAGVGLDVAFLFAEAGFNFGINDLLANDIQSNPYQVFVVLGFRF